MADIFTEITIQSVSAFIGGGAVAAIPPIVQLIRRRRGHDESGVDDGGVPIFTGSSFEGATIDNSRHVDNSDRRIDNRSIVIKHIRESGGSKDAARGGVPDDSIWLIVIALIAAAALFANYYPIVSWFSLGVGVGFAVTAVLGVVRAVRSKLWGRGAAIVLIEAVLAIIAVVWTWVAVFSSEHKGATLETLRAQMAVEVARSPITPGPLEWVQRHILAPVGAFVEIAFSTGQMIFLISLFGAFVVSFMVMLLVWARLYDWYVYLGFLFGAGSRWAAKRAEQHRQLTVADLWMILLMVAIAIFFASGAFVGLADAGMQSPAPAGG